MFEIGAIREVESAAYAAWPAAEHVRYDGWDLRYAYGFSRRGNSVYPAQPSTIDRGLKLERCGEWYRERGLELVVRQNPATEPGLDEMLEASGFTYEGLTHVMVGDTRADVDPSGISETVTEEWWTTAADLWEIGPDRAAGWRGIVERIDHPAGFAVIREAGKPIAVGLGVTVGRWLGVFEVIVGPSYRRRGIGSRLTGYLLAWGAARGAQRALLQVVAENTAAIRLYEGLGFEFAYPYWYRRAPVK